ncbi:T9SS type A sorting domain-containing protein [Persicobacter psychrovividus]|uniref:T9SS type A sorting domain-containing protein n=1 Tax=Persicobacter psychrovividus TaxID=387638 RepID=UPI0030CA39EE
MKTLYHIFGVAWAIAFILAANNVQAQTVVNSLEELKPLMAKDNVNVKVAPGTYSITKEDFWNGNWGYIVHPEITYAMALMLFEGSNSTYDFTDVTIKMNTDLFTAFGDVDLWEVQVIGNNNVLKGLTIIDDGSVDDAPTRGVCNVVIDGKQNVIDGFHVTAKGSFPYAYGDMFGKGGGGNFVNHKKHSGILIRGEDNTLKNTTLIQRAYGHCVFMQAAVRPTIDGCYIEGEMRSTDEVLAEAGTGSIADVLDMETVWGYKVPPGYMYALCEEGIRSYNAGETIVDGKYIKSRGASDITVLNSTVKNVRGGVSLRLASGNQYVENVTLLGCEFGFSPGFGTVVNCRADAAYGAAFMNTYDNDNNVSVDLTILPASGPYMNGSKCVAYIGCDQSNITLKYAEGVAPEDLEIRVGGDSGNKGLLGESNQTGHTGNDNIINNFTPFPMVFVEGSNNNTVATCGPVEDNASGNTFLDSDECPLNLAINGVATQSSTEGDAVAAHAIDGDTDSQHGVFSQTNLENDPWWELDLGNAYNLRNVVVFDTEQHPLTAFNIIVTDENGAITFSELVDDLETTNSIFLGDAIGQRIKIQLDAESQLTLKEVQVYGSLAENIRIQAQDNVANIGVMIESTSDMDGDEHARIEDKHSFMDFEVEAPQSGMYRLALRVSVAEENRKLSITENNEILDNVLFSDVSPDGGWETVYTWINLNAGNHTLRFKGLNADWKINWFELTYNGNFAEKEIIDFPEEPDEEEVISDADGVYKNGFKILPNPVTDIMTIKLPESALLQATVEVVILDTNGSRVEAMSVLNTGNGLSINIQHLSSGIYFVHLSLNEQTFSGKIIKR